jgi:hypothetical protein
MNPPNIEYSQRKGWFGRNWKWFIPTGCLSAILIAAGVVAAIVSFAFGALKSSDVYQEALTKAKSNPAVVRALGEPIKAGWFASGSIKVNGSSGEANLSIPVSGPKKSGRVNLLAEKKMGKWYFSALDVEIEGASERIDLLQEGQRGPLNPQ